MQRTAELTAREAALLAEEERGRKPPVQIIALAIAAVVVAGYLVATALSSSAVYYLTVSELKAKGAAADNQSVRIGGRVVDGTIHRTSAGQIDSFVLTDGSGTLPVVFHGIAPDLFGYAADGRYQDAVIEGKLAPNGTFQASQIIVKHDANFQPAGGASPPMSTTPGAVPPKRG